MQSVEINSFVRGYHAYMSVWDPVVREELQLEREPENMEDQRAVAVKKNGQVVCLRAAWICLRAVTISIGVYYNHCFLYYIL